MSAVARIEETPEEIATLRLQLKQAYETSRRVRITLLGIKADAAEALGPIRLQRAEDDLKQGLKTVQQQLDELEAFLAGT